MWNWFPQVRLYHRTEAAVKDKERQRRARLRPAPGLVLWLCLASVLFAPSTSTPFVRLWSSRWLPPSAPPPVEAVFEKLPLPAGARTDDKLTRLFTPAHAHRGAYSVYVSDAPLEKCLEHFLGLPRSGELPRGAWEIERMEPLAAFGASGPYPRWRVALIFGGSSVRVARGAILDTGRFLASVTLLSPHPSPGLERLEQGTMIVVFQQDQQEM